MEKETNKFKNKYPISKELKNKHKNYASSFKFVDDLCKILKDDEIVVTDMGTSFTCTMQAFKQKIINDFGHQVVLLQWDMGFQRLLELA